MSIRPLFFITALLSISTSLFCQENIIGTWKVTATNNNSTGDVLYGSVDFSGQVFQFLEDDILVIENEWGCFYADFVVSDAKISFNESVLGIIESNDTQLKLSFKDAATGRDLELVLDRREGSTAAADSGLELMRAEGDFGDFKTNGIYYRFNEERGTYSYLRFLKNGQRISRAFTSPPEEVLSKLNGAYIFRSGGQVELNTRNYADSVKAGVAILITNHTKSEFSYDMLDAGKNLVQHYFFENFMMKDREPTTSQSSYEFYPTERLALWIPKKEYQVCPFLDLPLAAPEPSDKVYRITDPMPQFPCADCDGSEDDKKLAQQALLKYIYQNIQYDEKSMPDGTVVITFIVDERGYVSDAEVARTVNEACDNEALRVINKMIIDGIQWTPGKANGVPVKVKFNMPIKFSNR